MGEEEFPPNQCPCPLHHAPAFFTLHLHLHPPPAPSTCTLHLHLHPHLHLHLHLHIPQISESSAIPRRLATLTEDVGRQTERERGLQEEFKAVTARLEEARLGTFPEEVVGEEEV